VAWGAQVWRSWRSWGAAVLAGRRRERLMRASLRLALARDGKDAAAALARWRLFASLARAEQVEPRAPPSSLSSTPCAKSFQGICVCSQS
jgi:hypothetical protein